MKNLTRRKLRKMILQEMDFAGGTGLDPETAENIIQAIKLLLSAGTIAAGHIFLLLAPIIRIHAMDSAESIDFEAAKDQIMKDPRIAELVQNVEPGMGFDPSSIDGDAGFDIQVDEPYAMEYMGDKVPGNNYELYDPYGDGTEGDDGEYPLDMGDDIDSDRLDEARRLRRRRLRRRRSI